MGRGNRVGFYHVDCSSFIEEWVELDNMRDYLIVVGQKIPVDWLVNIYCSGKGWSSNSSCVKYRFGIMGFSTNDAILGLCFLLLLLFFLFLFLFSASRIMN